MPCRDVGVRLFGFFVINAIDDDALRLGRRPIAAIYNPNVSLRAYVVCDVVHVSTSQHTFSFVFLWVVLCQRESTAQAVAELLGPARSGSRHPLQRVALERRLLLSK